MYKCEHYTDSIFYQMEQTAKFCKYLGMRIFDKLNFPITVDEFAAMDIMAVHGEICQRELARLILKDRPSTGRVLNSLEAKGYIERFVDTKNNRLVRRMKLTEEGRVITDSIAAQLKEYIAKLPKYFSTEDKQTLNDLIIRFRKNLEKEVEVNI